MILEKLHKILLIGLVAVFIFGSSHDLFAAKGKKNSSKKPSASHVSKKAASKKKASTASAKKKSASRKKSSAKKSSKVKVSRTSKKRRSLPAVSRKQVIKKDTSYVSPDDLPALEDDPEDLPVETQSVNVSQLLEKYVTSNQANMSTDSIDHKEKMIMEIIKYLDTPYKFGGNTAKGIDCSAFTKTVFGNTFSVELPRTAREQFQLGQEINDRSELKFGDLVFFNTRKRVRPGHVGIYIGDHLFAHSSSKQGVMVSS
ncbi:MAG: C40 family peptidase, partial [Bacillota bacterium]